MKKLITTVLLIGSMFLLTGCDLFNEGIESIWYDEVNETLNISYSFNRPSEDEATGELPVEHIFLYSRYENDEEWNLIMELENYSEENLQIKYQFEIYGNIELKIERQDSDGITTDSSDIFNIYINEPQFIYNFDTYFDSWSGEVKFNFGLNENIVHSITIQKSNDGGLTWEDVFLNEPIKDDNEMMKYELKYYEYNEGNYVYKLSAYREDNSIVGYLNTWGEINISFQDKVFEGNPEMWNIGSSIDPYSRNVSIWFDASGDFEVFLIEKSIDLITWEIIGEVPRFASNFNYVEDVDGEYYYKVSAVTENETFASIETNDTLRVKEGMLIGYLNGWIEWDTQTINVNWDFLSDDVTQVLVERKLDDGEFVLVGEFGGLKKMLTDENLEAGKYIYRVSVLNDNGDVLDQVESYEFVIETVVHVYHLNAWHNQSTGEVEFYFGFNQAYVTNYSIEKSSDGGLTWEEFIVNDVEFLDNNWYVDSIKVYEINEGVYTYRMIAYDDNENNLGTVYNYNEVIVQYDNLNFDEPTEIFYLDGNYNIYDDSINLWWSSQGSYDNHLIEYSIDGDTWTELISLPRITSYTHSTDLSDGEYLFRISVVEEDGTVIDTYEMDYTLRVKHDAYIGSFNVYFDWNSDEVQLNWDIIKDDVAIIQVERKLVSDTEFTLIGEFGPLKTTLFDLPTESNSYIYKLTLLDETGAIIDSIESNEITLELLTDN